MLPTIRALLVLAVALAGCTHPPAPGTPRLVKRSVVETQGLGVATGFAELHDGGQTRLLVAGQLGARVYAAGGALLERIDFPTDCGRLSAPCPAGCRGLSTPWYVVPVDIDGDGVLEFVNRGGNRHCVGVFERNGEIRWTYASETGPDWMSTGDLDGDGETDFVVGLSGDGGVRRLDANGKPIWQMRDGNVWRVELVDADRDGSSEILHTNADGDFVLRSSRGSVLDRFHTSFYATAFDVLSDGRVVQHAWGNFVFLDPHGREHARWRAATGGVFSNLVTRELELGMGPGRELAILESDLGLAVLHVFASDGALLHEELLDGDCRGLGARSSEGGLQELLLGCRDQVFGYGRAKRRESGMSVRSAAALLEPGDALGPLSLGEPRTLVELKLRLLPGMCLAAGCHWIETQLEGLHLLVGVQFEDERLARVIAMGEGAASTSDPKRLRSEWERFVAMAGQRFGAPSRQEPGFRGPTTPGKWWVTHTWDRAGARAQVGILSDEEDASGGFAAVLLVESRSPADEPVPASVP